MKLNSLTKIIITLVVFLGLANLIATNFLATGGRELSDVNQQTIALQKDNLILKNKIAEHTSLSTISDRALALGFVPVSGTLVIGTSVPVAYVAK